MAGSEVSTEARKEQKLGRRIDKPYRFYPPKKGDDSLRYPKLKRVSVSLQRRSTNYTGRYILQAARQIPPEEIAESRDVGFPTVLVIGPGHYLGQVRSCLEQDDGLVVEPAPEKDTDDVKALFMTVWRPSTRSAENSYGIRQG